MIARLIHLGSWFLLGSVAFTCIGWIATIDSVCFTLVCAVLAFVLIAYGLCWLLDDAIYRVIRVDELDYKAGLIAFGAAALIGVSVAVCIGRNGL